MSGKYIVPVFLVIFLLGGCSSYDRFAMAEPATPEEATCIRQCETAKERCMIREERIHTYCMEAYRLQRRNHEICEQARGNLPASCHSPQPCQPPDRNLCIGHFSSCRSDCSNRNLNDSKGNK